MKKESSATRSSYNGYASGNVGLPTVKVPGIGISRRFEPNICLACTSEQTFSAGHYSLLV